MSDIAIKVENLGKKYTLGGQKSAVFTVSSFCESITNLFSRNSKNVEPKTQNESTPNASEFWALKDINFEIKRGEAVGAPDFVSRTMASPTSCPGSHHRP